MTNTAVKQYNDHRKFVTAKLLAEYFGVCPRTITRRLLRFRPDYDLHSLVDLLDFVKWHNKKYE